MITACHPSLKHHTYTLTPFRAVIEALQAENADLKKNLSLAGSRQNQQKVTPLPIYL